MTFNTKIIFLLVLSLFLFSCNKKPGGSDHPGSSGSDQIQKKDPEVSLENVVLPDGIKVQQLKISESTIAKPSRILNYVPVGEVRDIGFKNVNHVEFKSGLAEIIYEYDEVKLNAAGLIEEFQVFYYDSNTGSWKPVDKVIVDHEANKVTAYTSHFTPFVLTAAPLSNGSKITAPPQCIQSDFPSGISGSADAQFTTIDENFKYYQDRDYYIVPLAGSTENTKTFQALGLEGSLGISTCNGNSSCGSTAEHKTYVGSNYIVFTAHKDIDIYLMYDSRGGSSRNDTSKDAPWLSDLGFTNTGYFIETTDAVRFYTVYKKSYSKGETVRLHGNRKEVSDWGINTNYWIIVKSMGSTANEPASGLCEASPDNTAPANVSNIKAIPGSKTVTLTWQNPDDSDFAGVVIRRSTITAPQKISDGEAVSGSKIDEQTYRDENLTNGQTYYYSIFALDYNQNYNHGGSTVLAIPSTDSDGDGLSDNYENTVTHTNPNSADSDGDGVSDGNEIIQGTDPVSTDITAPMINKFQVVGATVTENTNITFEIEGTDDTAITHWLVNLSAAKPLANSPNWQSIKPSTISIPAVYGNKTIYAWAKDAAGNISDAVSFTVTRKEATLAGIVKDSHGSPIAGAGVRIYNGSYSKTTVSDNFGYYEFMDVPSGSYYVVAKRDGYTLFTATVTIP